MANKAVAQPGWYRDVPGSAGVNWNSMMNQKPLPPTETMDSWSEADQMRWGLLQAMQYQPRTPTWQAEMDALRGVAQAAPIAPPPAPVSPFAPSPTGVAPISPAPTTAAPTVPFAPPATTPATGTAPLPARQPQQTWQEILDSWMQKLGGAKTSTTQGAGGEQPKPPISTMAPGGINPTIPQGTGVKKGEPKPGNVQLYDPVRNTLVEVASGDMQPLLDAGYQLIGNFTDPTAVPTTPLPRGYQWSLETKAGSAEYSYTDPVTLKTQIAPAVPTTYRWVPQWVGSDEMDDYQKATLAFNEAKANADRSQELLIAAVGQGNADRLFEAKQQLDAANLELDRATSALNQAKFEQTKTEATQKQTNWEKEFTSTEQKKAFDQLVKMADMAANPRDFVKLWLLQGNDWYKDIVSQVLNKGASPLNITPPSLAGWNQMSPSAKEGFASIISSTGIPPEDYMSTVARTLWPQKAGPTATRYAPFVQR